MPSECDGQNAVAPVCDKRFQRKNVYKKHNLAFCHLLCIAKPPHPIYPKTAKTVATVPRQQTTRAIPEKVAKGSIANAGRFHPGKKSDGRFALNNVTALYKTRILQISTTRKKVT